MCKCGGSHLHIPQARDYRSLENLGFYSNTPALIIMLPGGVPIPALAGKLKARIYRSKEGFEACDVAHQSITWFLGQTRPH